MHDNAEELFPVVNENGNTIGQATRGHCHNGSMLLHPVVHLHVFNSKGELYLQQRPMWKDIQPGRWDTAVGGHIGYGEEVGHALRRETREELGITDFKPEFLGRYVFTSSRERELVYSHYTIYNGLITPSEETQGGKFWNVQEIERMLGLGTFTPNFENEFIQLLKSSGLVQKIQAKIGRIQQNE